MVKHFENLDIENIVTPVNARRLKELLEQSEYDVDETQFLVDGFTNGFDIGYEGPIHRRNTSNNIPFWVGNKEIMWEKIMKEVSEKRVAGPFKREEIPFKYFVQSPLGLVPKANGKTRLIFHLSYDFPDGNKSINFHVPKSRCTVKYNDLDCAVRACLELDFDQIFFGKTDISNAFRLVPTSRSSWRWTIMSAEDPETGETGFFIDKALPFGGSISCSHFQRFSEALKHIIQFRDRSLKLKVINYLDDFLFIEEDKDRCDLLVRKFLNLAEELGIKMAEEKTEWGENVVVFLGILLDGNNKVLCVPEEKRVRAIKMLKIMLDKRKATVKEMERLSGYLNFLNKAIHPGRAFTRRMYAKFAMTMEKKKLKQHHHIHLDKEFKDDCGMWLKFLEPENKLVTCRPFVDLSFTRTSEEIDFYTDASGSMTRGGFGCKFQKSWMRGDWNYEFISEEQPSIGYLELIALAIGVTGWIDRLQNSRITVFCDNKSVRDMINSTSSNCKRCMRIIRILTLLSLKWNTRIFVKYVETKKNDVADALSRGQMKRFEKLRKKFNMNREPDKIPDILWPIEKVWQMDS